MTQRHPTLARGTASAARILLALLALGVATARAQPAPPDPEGPIPSLYSDPGIFETALAEEKPRDDGALTVTGLIAPHHLLAADLIARAIWAARKTPYARVVILCPDHFNKSRRPIATTTRDIDTVFGPAINDRGATTSLAAHRDLFDNSDLFAGEHGIQALLPFVRKLFPAAHIVPIAFAVTSTQKDWDRAFELLAPLAGPGTLVIQSTDFSHYLTPQVAQQRDQESLNVIAGNRPEDVLALIQPDHLDSKAAFYLMMRLATLSHSRPVVLANRNSAEYHPGVQRTTSYVAAAYAPDLDAAPIFPDQTMLVFGGDFFAGRWLTMPLAAPATATRVVDRVRALTKGAPLVLNLEGSVAAEVPPNLPPDLHAMDAGLALPLLRRLNAVAVSLANNHSFDLGASGLMETGKVLAGSGIKPLRNGRIEDLGPIRVVALNYVGQGAGRPGYPSAGPREIEQVCRDPAKPPVVAFVHWGREYTTEAGPRELATVRALQACGIAMVVGAHSHQASPRIETTTGGEAAFVYSLGNFLFDQHSPRGSGQLLELRVFKQGTYAARLVALPNFFDEAVRDAHARHP